MKWLSTGAVIVTVLSGCQSEVVEKDLGLKLLSPSGKYSLVASERATPNEEPKISLGLRNATGDILTGIRTDVPASMKWAVGWAPGEDVVVLYSDKATWVYIISKNQLKLMECPQARYGDIGRELKGLKYGSSEGKAEPSASANGAAPRR